MSRAWLLWVCAPRLGEPLDPIRAQPGSGYKSLRRAIIALLVCSLLSILTSKILTSVVLIPRYSMKQHQYFDNTDPR